MLVSSRAASDAANADFASEALESDALPTEKQWEAVREHAKRLQANFEDTRSQLRRTQRVAHVGDTVDSIVEARAHPSRARKFGARRSAASVQDSRCKMGQLYADALPRGVRRGGSRLRRPLTHSRSPHPFKTPGDGSFINPLSGPAGTS